MEVNNFYEKIIIAILRALPRTNVYSKNTLDYQYKIIYNQIDFIVHTMNRKLTYYKLQRSGGWCEPGRVKSSSAWEWLMMNQDGFRPVQRQKWPQGNMGGTAG